MNDPRVYFVCSSPKCKFSAQWDFKDKGCPMCGSEIITQCPECGSSLKYKNQAYCSECKIRIKPEAEPVE